MAAHAGLLAIALLEKVVRLEARRTANASDMARWEQALESVENIKGDLLRLRGADVLAYDGLAKSLRAGKDCPDFVPALEAAVECPLLIICACAESLRVLGYVKTGCGKHLVPDLRVASELLAAASSGAYHIAMANTELFSDDTLRAERTHTLCAALTRTEAEMRKHWSG